MDNKNEDKDKNENAAQGDEAAEAAKKEQEAAEKAQAEADEKVREEAKAEQEEAEERRDNAGPATPENAKPVVPPGDPNSTSPGVQVASETPPNEGPVTDEVPGQPATVEKNRIEVPDVSHAGEQSEEKPATDENTSDK